MLNFSGEAEIDLIQFIIPNNAIFMSGTFPFKFLTPRLPLKIKLKISQGQPLFYKPYNIFYLKTLPL